MTNDESFKSKLKAARSGALLLSAYSGCAFILPVFFVLGMLGKLGISGVKDGGVYVVFWILFAVILYVLLFVFFVISLSKVLKNSTQIGLKLKIFSICFGFIPYLNIPFIMTMIKTVLEEYSFETAKIRLDEGRVNDQICKTKYPLLMVHGVFFRDFKNFNYWGRIPGELEKNGASVFYGDQQSANAVEEAAEEIVKKINQIREETGADKVNIIAHSKGGLDCRYAISVLGMAPYVASLTTINTPHQGCHWSEHLLEKFHNRTKKAVAKAYNKAFKKLGDPNPDFLGGVQDLGYKRCQALNKVMPDMDGIFYQSTGSKINRASGGQFPLWISYNIVKRYDGENDGLVGGDSYKWGEKVTFLSTKCRRGISHGDMIDLNRRNLKAFDVREFYVQLVKDLKDRGL